MALIELEHITWKDAEVLDDNAIGLIAVGATEQHGPHLPMGMDNSLADAFTRGIGAAIEEPIVVGPRISCGLSDHHLEFPGTISLSEDTLTQIFDAYIDSFVRLGIRRIALISGHGGNFSFLDTYATNCSSSNLIVVNLSDMWSFFNSAVSVAHSFGLEPVASDAHAGLVETGA